MFFQKPIFPLIAICFVSLSFFSCNSKQSTEQKTSLSKEKYANPSVNPDPIVDFNLWKIENGKFYLDNEWVFLKIGKPLINFADPVKVDNLISDLDKIQQNHFNTLELNCYWHHFDTDGDGIPDKSLDPLNKLIAAIYAKGIYPCLSVETYAVGGGTIPDGFWSLHPDAFAINDKGEKVTDTEYGFGSKVVSIFHPGYRSTVHTFIKRLAEGVDTRKILYFETTVEPQYMGTIPLCYSDAARDEYNSWREVNSLTDPASEMPASFPLPASFVTNPTWNKFRAQFLAKWVNDDAAAYREVAGDSAYVAVDYLDADEKDQQLRMGDPIEFLTHLTGANIIQVNWSWYFPSSIPNQKAYDRVNQVMKETNRDWAITEHMTFNGSDFVSFEESRLQSILENTLNQGTRFGWEFVSVTNETNSNFSLYYDDWSPKPVMKFVDQYWGYWLHRTAEIEKKEKGA